MSKVVGQRWVRYGGSDETLVPVTCCEEARLRVAALEETNRLLRALANNINPHVEGGLILVYQDGPMKVNYCPVCGEKYRGAAK